MKYIVGFSGWIDSTFVAWLLKKQWHDVLLINLKITSQANKCCALDTDLIWLAEKLWLKLEIINVIEEFKSLVIKAFVQQYLQWKTPNPCINCNEYVRFFVLEQIRKKYWYDKISTWHYAYIKKTSIWFVLQKAIDQTKDQSYMLYRLIDKPFLKYLDFPMWKFEKNNVKNLIKKYKIPYLTMKESQNICFVENDDYPAFIKNFSNIYVHWGPIYDIDWKYLWEHKWLIYYTIWQRKWLNIASNQKLYVTEIDYKNNTLIVWPEKYLYKDKITIQNFITYPFLQIENIQNLANSWNLEWKIRYHHQWEKIENIKFEDKKAFISFKKPVRAPTPWQHLVIYNWKNVIWWGEII